MAKNLFTGIITDEFKQLHIDMLTELVRGCSVPCQVIYGGSKFTDCPNCLWDAASGRSANQYQSGGPIPFTGICPYCHGIGKITDEQTEDIDLCVLYDYKSWVKLGAPVNNPNGLIQTLSLYSTINTLTRAKEIIANTDVDVYVRQRFERNGEPKPCGLGNATLVVCMWKRIEN